MSQTIRSPRCHFTYNFEINSKPNKKGVCRVMLRLHRKGCKPARMLTSVELPTLTQWNPGKSWGRWVGSSNPHHRLYNRQLEALYFDIKQTVDAWLQVDQLTPLQVKARLEATNNAPSYKQLALEAIQRVGVSSTIRGKITALNALLSVLGEDLQLDHLTGEAVQRAQNNLLKERGLSPATINQYLASLNPVHIDILVSQGVPRKKAALSSPFVEVDALVLKKAPINKKDSFTLDQVAMLQTILLNRKKGSRGRTTMNEQDALAVWLLCYQLAGMRISDVLRLRYQDFFVDQEGRLRCTYQMKKNGKYLSIPADHAVNTLSRFIRPGAAPSDYLLPFLDSRQPYATLLTVADVRAAPVPVQTRLDYDITRVVQRINRALRELLKVTGIAGKMTSHTARHSLATQAQQLVNQGKLAAGVIQTSLAHDNARTTKGYTGQQIIRADELTKVVFSAD